VSLAAHSLTLQSESSAANSGTTQRRPSRPWRFPWEGAAASCCLP